MFARKKDFELLSLAIIPPENETAFGLMSGLHECFLSNNFLISLQYHS